MDPNKTPNIYLASKSNEKVQAVIDGWRHTCTARGYPKDNMINVHVFEVQSGVPDQPLNDQIRQGALNRIAEVEKLASQIPPDRNDVYYVAFESGIWVDQGAEFGEEGTMVMIKHKNQVVEVKSACRRYPYFIIRQAQNEGITNLKEQNKLVSAWFKSAPVAPGSATRTEVMAAAVIQAFHKLSA